MGISRGQMQRQLYASGGIRSLVPREHYGLGSIFKGAAKAVKGVVKGVGKLASSDIGKMAMLAAIGGYPFMGGAGTGIAGTGWFGSGSALGKLGGMLKSKGIMETIGKGFSGANKFVGKVPGGWGTVLSLGGGAIAGMLARKPEETEEAYKKRIQKVKPYLRQYMTAAFKNSKSPQEIEELIETNTSEYRVADGGLISRKGFALGTNGNGWHQGDWTDPNDPDYEPKPQKLSETDALHSLLKEFIEVHKRYPKDMEELKQWAMKRVQGGSPEVEEVSTSLAEVIPSEQESAGINAPREGFHEGSLRHQKQHDYEAYERSGDWSKGPSTPENWVDKVLGKEKWKYIPERDAQESYMKERFMYGEHKEPIIGIGQSELDKKINDWIKEKFLNLVGKEDVPEELEALLQGVRPEKQEGGLMNLGGGRIGYALGPMDPMLQGGIGDIPTRQNNAGVTELDFRDNGGFVPPIGIKEKADDIPAMVSNNEFVMTADAVKGMGGGSVERGSQRMYDMMKQLEGKVINA